MDRSYVGMFDCYYCGEPAGIMMDKRLKDTLPRNIGVVDYTPCHECEGWMKQGVILISVKDGEMEKSEAERLKAKTDYERDNGHKSPRWRQEHPYRWMANPIRTGGWVVVKDEVIERSLNNEETIRTVLERRWAFVPDEAWDALEFPREEVEDETIDDETVPE